MRFPGGKLSVRLIVATFCFVALYGSNARLVTGGDTLAHLYVATSVWETGDFNLREFEADLRKEGELPYFVVEDNGRLRTIFSFCPGLLLLPFGPILELSGGATLEGWAGAGKIANSLFTFAAGILLWLLLKDRTSRTFADVWTAAFWFCTPLWPLSMNYLQHQPAILFQFVCLFLLFGRGEGETRECSQCAFWAGFCEGVAVLARYQVLLTAITLVLLLAFLWRRRFRLVGLFLAGASGPAVALLLYNRLIVGSFFDIGYVVYPWATLTAPFWPTLSALLANPSKGLFLHSPWLVTLVVGIWICISRVARKEGVPPLLLACAVIPWPLFFLYSKYTGWFGGWSWGYRFLLDILPMLVILSAYGGWKVWHCRVIGRVAISVLVLAGFIVQAIGAFSWDGTWHRIHDLGTAPYQNWLWQVRYAQPAWYLRRGAFYIGEKRIEVREDPFEERGLYEEEVWDGRVVAWTGPEGASFYGPVREYPLEIHFYPSDAVSVTSEPLHVEFAVNGELAARVAVESQEWQSVRLEGVPFQHGAVVTVTADRTWREPSEGGREVGVALQIPQ